jgi:hypothetical protein
MYRTEYENGCATAYFPTDAAAEGVVEGSRGEGDRVTEIWMGI